MEFIAAVLLVVATAQAQVIPSQYTVSNGARSANRSSSTGHCLNILAANDIGMHTCMDPSSSVLFDGIIPTLTGLDGDMWASQLLTLRSNTSGLQITFNFATVAGFTGVRSIEIVLFNCPEWGISIQSIALRTNRTIGNHSLTITSSCNSLPRVCLRELQITNSQRELSLIFTPIHSTDWVHIAEVTFYDGAGFDCRAIPTPTPLPSITPSPPPTISAELTTHPETEQCPSSTILTSVLTAISTALLATVIFVLVQIALCKCRPKAIPKGAESAPSAGEEGPAEYEEIDVEGERGVAESGPTYMEVGAGGGGRNTMELKENTAYGAFRT